MTEPTFPIGETLVGVQYELLSWEVEPTSEDPIDEVSMAVVFVWGSAVTRISWSSDTEREGLAFGGPGPSDPTPEVRIEDVSGRWSSVVGERLVSCGFSYANPDARLPWAVDLSLTSGRHILVALGELLPQGLAYIPDSLVVTDSPEILAAFLRKPEQRET